MSSTWPGFSITADSDRQRDLIEVVDYDTAWPGIYEKWRDRLAYPAARDAYADAKRAAARTWHDDRWAYPEAKTGIILDLLEAAEQWAQSMNWEPQPQQRPSDQPAQAVAVHDRVGLAQGSDQPGRTGGGDQV